jgi:hypothetical protein
MTKSVVIKIARSHIMAAIENTPGTLKFKKYNITTSW